MSKLKEMLNNYQSNKFQIEERKRIQLKIENEMYEVHSPNCIQVLSDMPKGSSTSDQTSDTALKIIDEKEKALKKLDKMIRVLEQEVKVVDSLIGVLKYKEQVFIKKIYREKKQLKDIEYEMNYSDYKSVQRAYSKILNKLEKEYKKTIVLQM